MRHLSTYQIFEAGVTNYNDPIVIIKKLNKNKSAKYTLNTDNSIDVEGNVDISSLNLKEMPVKFGKVTGNFNCSDNDLTSLKHCPTTIVGDFYCSSNELTSLEHGPITISGDFYCSNNLLTSLEHGPTVLGNFYCFNNKFPEKIQKKIDNFEGTWQELLFLMNIWQSKKLTDLDKKTGLFN
jgi:hypothetical protein